MGSDTCKLLSCQRVNTENLVSDLKECCCCCRLKDFPCGVSSLLFGYQMVCSENSAAFSGTLSFFEGFSAVAGPMDDVDAGLVSLGPVVGGEDESVFGALLVHPGGGLLEKWLPRVGLAVGVRMEGFELVVGGQVGRRGISLSELNWFLTGGVKHGEVDSSILGQRMRILVDRDTYQHVWGDMVVKILDKVGALLSLALVLSVVEDIWDCRGLVALSVEKLGEVSNVGVGGVAQRNHVPVCELFWRVILG